jgi:hypothetical protein
LLEGERQIMDHEEKVSKVLYRKNQFQVPNYCTNDHQTDIEKGAILPSSLEETPLEKRYEETLVVDLKQTRIFYSMKFVIIFPREIKIQFNLSCL